MLSPSHGGLDEQNFADDPQDMTAAFARWNELLHLVTEQDEADLIVITDGGEGEHGGDLGGEFALGLVARAEQTRAAHVHDQHHGQRDAWYVMQKTRLAPITQQSKLAP